MHHSWVKSRSPCESGGRPGQHSPLLHACVSPASDCVRGRGMFSHAMPCHPMPCHPIPSHPMARQGCPRTAFTLPGPAPPPEAPPPPRPRPAPAGVAPLSSPVSVAGAALPRFLSSPPPAPSGRRAEVRGAAMAAVDIRGRAGACVGARGFPLAALTGGLRFPRLLALPGAASVLGRGVCPPPWARLCRRAPRGELPCVGQRAAGLAAPGQRRLEVVVMGTVLAGRPEVAV